MTNKVYIVKQPGELWWIQQEIIPAKVIAFVGDNITVRVNFKNGTYKCLKRTRQDIGNTIFAKKEDAEKALLGA